MTLALDSTALVALLLEGRGREVVLAAMERDDSWCAAAHALAESLAAIDRLGLDDEREQLEDELRRLWDYLAVVPLDQACVDEAGRLMRRLPMRTTDALHLAAAGRLPPPVRLVTLDAAQIPLAESLGIDVVSP